MLCGIIFFSESIQLMGPIEHCFVGENLNRCDMLAIFIHTYILNNMGKVISCLLNVFTKISNENGCEWALLFNYVKVIKGLGQILEQDVTKTKPWKQANLFKLHSFIQSTYQVYMVDTIDFVYLWYGMRVNTQMHDLSI